jgi:cell division protein FtsW
MVNNNFFNRSDLNFIQKWWLDIDKINFFFAFFLIIFGLVMTISASPAIAKRINVDNLFFIKKQLFFSLTAIFIMIIISFLNLRNITILGIIGIIISFTLMLYLLFFGVEVKGATRWVSFFGFTLQPSEFAKIFFIITNAYILHILTKRNFFIKYGSSFLLYILAITLLIMQPDFGMTVIFSIIWAMQLFLYGIPLILVFLLSILAIIGSFIVYNQLPHVRDRINRFLDLDAANYQAEMSVDAYINGSFFGTGPGGGIVKNFIPDAHTDFIFSVVAEEFGIISAIAIILIFFYIFMRIINRVSKEEVIFHYLALIGLAIQFMLQFILNIGVTLRLLPTKGMTLPFISYGGSATLSMAICFGIILALTKRRYHENIDYGNVDLILSRNNHV